MQNTKKRIEYLDVSKGIAILLVCVGHAISNQQNVRDIDLPILLRLISQFHMPLFFVISGYLFSDKHIDTPIKATIHKIKAYYVPFVVYNLIFLLFHNLFAALQLVNEQFNGGPYTWKQYAYRFTMVITGHRQSFGGAMWFLGSLLIISVLFIWSNYFIKKIIPEKYQQLCVCIFVLCCVLVGISGKCPTSFKLNVSLYSMLFFYLGYLYKKLRWNSFLVKYKTIVLLISVVGSIVIAYLSPVGIESKYYGNFTLFTISAVLGTLMIFMAAQYPLVEKSRVLKLLGEKSLDIMSLHFLAFKLVSLLVILVYDLPMERLAEYPVLTGIGGAWWVAYSLVGAFVPVGIRCGYDYIVKCIKNRGKQNG